MGQNGASLVALGGGLVGSFFGPVGQAVGLIAGSIVGNLLFAPDAIKGPRIGDLTVTSSAYGSPRPIGFGAFRQGGNIIWSSGIKSKRSKSGGKGGGDPATVKYRAEVSFALAFGQGPAEDVLRIWADGKLIYDRTGTEEDVQKAGLLFRFYKGTETQLPDALIEADKGVGNVPAHRGEVYIVFENMVLTDYGNRIPNITAEIAYSSTSSLPVIVATEIAGGDLTSVASDAFCIDWERGFAYVLDTAGTAPTTGLRRFNTRTMLEDRQITSEESLDQTTDGAATMRDPMVVLSDGSLFMQIDTVAGTNAEPFVHLDPVSLIEIARVGATGAGLTYGPTSSTLADDMAVISMVGLNGREDYVVCLSLQNDFVIYSVQPDSVEYVWSLGTFTTGSGSTRVKSCCGGMIGEGFGEGYVISGSQYISGSSENLIIHKMTVSVGASYSLIASQNTSAGVDHTPLTELTVADILPGETQLHNAGLGAMYDELDDTIIFHAQAESDLQNYLIKYDPNTETIVWRAALGNGPSSTTDRSWSQSRIRNSTVGFLRGTGGYLVDTRDGTVLENPATFATSGNTGSIGAYDSSSDTWVGQTTASGILARWFFNRKAGAPAAISDVLTTISGLVDLAPADIDVTDLTDNFVDGYGVARASSARDAINPLAGSFFFDGVESDFKVRFVERGQASLRTVLADDMIRTNERTGEVLTETIQQEVELPERLTVTYIDKDQDYEAGSHSVKRIFAPTPTMFSHNNVEVQIAAVFIADVARKIAEKLLYTSWAERKGLGFSTSWENIDLDPTDVVDLIDGSESFRTRLTQNDVGVSLALELEGVVEEASQYTSTVGADTGAGKIPRGVPTSFATRLAIIDTPLLRDSDEPAGRSVNPLYYMMGGYGQPEWSSGRLYASPDNADFSPEGLTVNEMTWGSTTNALGDPVAVFATDTTNTLTVAMATQDDPLESVTEAQMLNGANAAILLKNNGEVEVIQFQTVVDNGNGSFTLSTLLRGRRGTDTMATGHTVGETFILLVAEDTDIFPLDLAAVDAVRYYKGVGSGRMIEDVFSVALTSEGRALMPYAPVNQAAADGGGGDIDLSWERRTRVGGPLKDGGGQVPLSEDSEEYEVEILTSSSDPTIERTFLALTTPAVIYTAAQQSADSYTLPGEGITFRVYQISAQVGRGFFYEVTVPVI